MIAVRYTTLDRPNASAAYTVIANDQPVGEVRQLAGGTWLAVPSETSMLRTSLGGFRKRSDAVEWLLAGIGVLG